MNELIKITYDGDNVPGVSGRELHEFLQVGTPYHIWFPRMVEYGFSEGESYCTKMSGRSDGLPGKPLTDHRLTISMAKELCMIQRTERGKQARQYFLRLEAAWNTPEAVMAQALIMADRQILALRQTNSELSVRNAIMAPKADYFDELVNRNLLTGFRDTAKELHVKQTDFVTFLLERGYIYRSGKKGELKPCAQYVEAGLFEVKETFNEKTDWKGTQTMITPKGRETFRLLVPGARKGCAE